MATEIEYGVKQVSERLHGSLRRYLEGQYHISDPEIIEERRLLLDEVGTIGQRPYLETTPTYEAGKPYADLGLPSPVGETLTEMVDWKIGVFPRPYVHQAKSLTGFFNDKDDLIVATGTGSGKTESFLFPVIGHLLLEAKERPQSWKMPGCRALLLYPMNALVSDQVARLRRLLGDTRLAELFDSRYGRHSLFGMYTSRTPYPGVRNSKKDAFHLDKVLRYYLELEFPQGENAEAKKRLGEELRKSGRWPAKDLAKFFGTGGGRWDKRLQTQPGDRELLTRHEMQEQCPDLLVTNYSMLEYMLLRPIERNLFRQTKEWLEADKNNSLVLVLDEAHMYRGAGGAEVALLLRRLQARLGVGRERLRCILTSASLGEGADAEAAVKKFAVGLTGHPVGKPMPFQLVRGQLESRPAAHEGTQDEAKTLALFDLAMFFDHATNLRGAMESVGVLAAQMSGWATPPTPVASDVDEDTREAAEKEFRAYLYATLGKFGPVNYLIAHTSGKANEWSGLSKHLFPSADSDTAQAATATLIAMGTYARHDGRPLLPTRVHMFFRGLPSLYACVNARCSHRRHRPGDLLSLGRLYTEPRTHCECGARVYELYTHRDCGAAFLRVFGRGVYADFYWHEKGGTIEHEQHAQPLDETYLLAAEPHDDAHKKGLIEEIWMDMLTGRVVVQEPDDLEGYRKLYRPGQKVMEKKEDAKKNAGAQSGNGHRNGKGKKAEDSPFPQCPACLKRSGQKIMDLATKGEQPFATLVREQLTQQPAHKPQDEHYPNGGRKVLLFSDGRQKAARLARDLPREVEFDSIRQVIILAAKRLNDLNEEARLNERLYLAFMSVCNDHYLHFFDRDSLKQHNANLKHFRATYDADLETVIDALNEGEEYAPTLPEQYQKAVLRQLCDPYYSLYSACAAIVVPTKGALKSLKRTLSSLPVPFLENDFKAVASVWVQEMLERSAFDESLNNDTRREVTEFPRPPQHNEAVGDLEKLFKDGGQLTDAQIRTLREAFYSGLMGQNKEDSSWYLKPKLLALQIAVADMWYGCQACRLTSHQPLFGHCPHCGHDKLDELPPDHAYMKSRKAYFREPLREALEGQRLSHLCAEEHTAQLSQRDAGDTYATTEKFELRFQDVWLDDDSPPVDVLSCTTTMEVGIDIGSLTAVGLRNVPPQRENYQQRAGRSGRRGSAISTVVTYAQGGPHDNHYYSEPASIISGAPRVPKVKVDNRRLARRHIHSFLIQTFFHAQLDALPADVRREIETQRTNILSAFGPASDFYTGGDNPFTLEKFGAWLRQQVIQSPAPLATKIAEWLPDEICHDTATEMTMLAEKRTFAAQVAGDFLEGLESLKAKPLPGNENAEDGTVNEEDAANEEQNPGLLLNLLFDQGMLPSYAFPTDLCTFHVFERLDKGGARVKERPQQGKDKALSEYAPGRLLVVNKETYRVGGIYVEGTSSASPVKELFRKSLPVYVYCPTCSHTRLDKALQDGERCIVCSDFLRSSEFLDPPGFSPERGAPIRERDNSENMSFATTAQFPTPLDTYEFQWQPNTEANLRHTYETERGLIIVNKGVHDEGFRICRNCGAAWPEVANWQKEKEHFRPFLISQSIYKKATYKCNGPFHPAPIYLGYRFITDLLLLRVPLRAPIHYNPKAPWLHDAMRSLSEAVALAASRRLDIDPGELSAGYRLMPPTDSEDEGAQAAADIYLFDTASGGAGYAAEAGEILADVLDETMALLTGCPEGCERSCTKCLRHYGNRYYHERFDRHLAAQLLSYARAGTPPETASMDEQINLLRPLARYLELEGHTSTLGATGGTAIVPLLVTPQSKGRPVAIGLHPSLLDTEADDFAHPLNALDGRDDVQVHLLNDFVLTRDLPSAYQELCRAAGW